MSVLRCKKTSCHIMILSFFLFFFFSENYNFDAKRIISSDHDHIVISVNIIAIMQTYFVLISWVYYLCFHKQIMTAHVRMDTDVKATTQLAENHTLKQQQKNPRAWHQVWVFILYLSTSEIFYLSHSVGKNTTETNMSY